MLWEWTNRKFRTSSKPDTNIVEISQFDIVTLILNCNPALGKAKTCHPVLMMPPIDTAFPDDHTISEQQTVTRTTETLRFAGWLSAGTVARV